MLKIEVIAATFILALMAGSSAFALHEMKLYKTEHALRLTAEAQMKSNEDAYNAISKVVDQEEEERNDRSKFSVAGRKAIDTLRPTGDAKPAAVLGDTYKRLYLRQQAAANNHLPEQPVHSDSANTD